MSSEYSLSHFLQDDIYLRLLQQYQAQLELVFVGFILKTCISILVFHVDFIRYPTQLNGNEYELVLVPVIIWHAFPFLLLLLWIRVAMSTVLHSYIRQVRKIGNFVLSFWSLNLHPIDRVMKEKHLMIFCREGTLKNVHCVKLIPFYIHMCSFRDRNVRQKDRFCGYQVCDLGN